MYLDRTVRLSPSCIHKLMDRSCTQCAQIECIPNPSSSKGKSINPGVIAGPVVAALIILGVAALWWLRRKRVCPNSTLVVDNEAEWANEAEKGSSKSRRTSRTSTKSRISRIPPPFSARFTWSWISSICSIRQVRQVFPATKLPTRSTYFQIRPRRWTSIT